MESSIHDALNGRRYVLSSGFTLESCMMALDLEDPSMDRGCITVDGQSLWAWRDCLLTTPVLECDGEQFAVTAVCVFLRWLLHSTDDGPSSNSCAMAQDTLLCLVPLVSNDPRLYPGLVNNVTLALWFMINHVIDEIFNADFDKDERVTSRHFHGKRRYVYEPVVCGIAWLDDMQRWFHERRYFSHELSVGNNYDYSEASPLFQPMLANTFGIGCPRRLGSVNAYNFGGQLEQLNDHCKTMHHLLHHFRHSPFLTISEIADQLYTLSSSSCQFIRAVTLNILSAYHLTPGGVIWQKMGNFNDEREKQIALSAFKALLHAPPRSHRLLRDLIDTHLRHPPQGSIVFSQLCLHVKVLWVRMGMDVGLLHDDVARAEGNAWIRHLSAPLVYPRPIKPTRAFQHRWSCLL